MSSGVPGAQDLTPRQLFALWAARATDRTAIADMAVASRAAQADRKSFERFMKGLES